MATILIVTVIPSILMGYSIVQRTIYETSAQKFISNVFIFKNSEVVTSSIDYNTGDEGSTIEVIMMGEPLSSDAIESAENQLELFSLENTKLVVRQANKTDQVDQEAMVNVLRSNTQIIDEKNNEILRLRERLSAYDSDTLPKRAIARELASIWDEVKSVELSRAEVIGAGGELIGEKVVCLVKLNDNKHLGENDARKIKKWLEERAQSKDVRLVIDSPKEEKSVSDSIASATNVLMVE